MLVVPKFQCNLLSIPQLTHQSAIKIIFSAPKCIMQDPFLMMENEIGDLVDGLYKLQTKTIQSNSISAAHTSDFTKDSCLQWHWRLGHPSYSVLSHIKSLYVPSTAVQPNCDICHYSKQARLPFPIRESRSNSIFEIVQCDVWGPYKHMTHGNCNQFLTLVDDFSKCTWVF